MKKMPLDKIRHRFSSLNEEWARFKGAFDAFLSELDGELQKLSEENSSEHAPEKSPKSGKTATQQTGNFPYPVGILVRVAFPELFKRKAISAGDIAYLLSKKATDDFLTRGSRIIRLYTTEDDPGLYQSGHRRYYKIPPMELGAKKYHLTSQFFPESREPVLKWIYQHGLKKNELIELIENAMKNGKSE